jgi:LysR family glycine cleavage system transcriptional activator
MSPELQNLPSLQALLCVEAAARCGSFSRAARELYVTQSAISHQIRALEDELGTPLFVRGPRGVSPTEEGAALARSIQEGLGQIVACLRQLTASEPAAPQRIILGSPPSLTNHWLVARLGLFSQQHPGWSLSPQIKLGFHDLEKGEAHAALRYGLGDYPGYGCELISAERLVAVCAPSVWPEGTSLRHLRRLPVLQAYTAQSPRGESPRACWSQHTGVELGAQEITFNRQSMAVVAATEGQGVAIVPWQIARAALKRGALLRPVAHEAPDALSYYLVWRPERLAQSTRRLLVSWLRQQMDDLV